MDPVIQSAVWQRYESDRPRPGHDLNVWISRIAEESATPESAIRRIIGHGAGTMLNTINQRIQTFAQQLADVIGADLVNALGMLREAYTATKKKVLLDKQGRPKLIDPSPEGPGFTPENMLYVEVPDWHARLSAIRTTVEIYGARAPQQFEINQKTVTLDLTPQHAIAELARLAESIPRLQAALAADAAGDSGVARNGATAKGTTRHPRRALLADGMHPDEGRAGQAESL